VNLINCIELAVLFLIFCVVVMIWTRAVKSNECVSSLSSTEQLKKKLVNLAATWRANGHNRHADDLERML